MPVYTNGGFDQFDPHLPQRNENLSGERQTHARSTDDDDVGEECRIDILRAVSV
jgi:hypothetical protein